MIFTHAGAVSAEIERLWMVSNMQLPHPTQQDPSFELFVIGDDLNFL